MNSKIIRLYILVKGKVQGIGYRYFVTELANDMELKGWVRNLVSGNVDIEIQGEEDVVKEFVNKLNSGHP